LEDTGASGSGGPPTKQAATATTGTSNPEGAPAHDPKEEAEPLSRVEAITSFVASLLFPELNLLKIDHISVLMTLLSTDNGPIQKQGTKLFSMEYDHVAADLIWQAWAPHISPPARHPLAMGTLAKDLVLAALTKPFPTAKLARAGAMALTDAIADLISTQTFVDHAV
jgi:hypothetical protein